MQMTPEPNIEQAENTDNIGNGTYCTVFQGHYTGIDIEQDHLVVRLC